MGKPKTVKVRVIVRAPAMSAQHAEDVERLNIRAAYTDDRRKTLYAGEHEVVAGQSVTVWMDAEPGREIELCARCRPRDGHPQANDSRELRNRYVVGDPNAGPPNKIAPGQYVIPHPSSITAECVGNPVDPVEPPTRPEPDPPTEITPDMDAGQ